MGCYYTTVFLYSKLLSSCLIYDVLFTLRLRILDSDKPESNLKLGFHTCLSILQVPGISIHGTQTAFLMPVTSILRRTPNWYHAVNTTSWYRNPQDVDWMFRHLCSDTISC